MHNHRSVVAAIEKRQPQLDDQQVLKRHGPRQPGERGIGAQQHDEREADEQRTPADPIRIAYIDPLSGPFAATGENGLNQFKYATEALNKGGGVLGRQLEIVPLDNKVSPQESLIQLKKVTKRELREAIVDGWLAVAPPKLAEEYLKGTRRRSSRG